MNFLDTAFIFFASLDDTGLYSVENVAIFTAKHVTDDRNLAASNLKMPFTSKTEGRRKISFKSVNISMNITIEMKLQVSPFIAIIGNCHQHRRFFVVSSQDEHSSIAMCLY
jgi:hypothetical protein